MINSANTIARSLLLLLAFCSMSAIADVSTKNDIIGASQAVDYDNAKQVYATYFLSEKLAKRFTKELMALPNELRYSLLDLAVLSNDKFPSNTSARDKHTFAIWLLKAHQNIQKKTGTATLRVESLSKKYPELSALLSKRLLPRAKVADWTPGVDTDFTSEQKAELAKLQKQTALIKANNETLDRLSGAIPKTKANDN